MKNVIDFNKIKLERYEKSLKKSQKDLNEIFEEYIDKTSIRISRALDGLEGDPEKIMELINFLKIRIVVYGTFNQDTEILEDIEFNYLLDRKDYEGVYNFIFNKLCKGFKLEKNHKKIEELFTSDECIIELLHKGISKYSIHSICEKLNIEQHPLIK